MQNSSPRQTGRRIGHQPRYISWRFSLLLSSRSPSFPPHPRSSSGSRFFKGRPAAFAPDASSMPYLNTETGHLSSHLLSSPDTVVNPILSMRFFNIRSLDLSSMNSLNRETEIFRIFRERLFISSYINIIFYLYNRGRIGKLIKKLKKY